MRLLALFLVPFLGSARSAVLPSDAQSVEQSIRELEPCRNYPLEDFAAKGDFRHCAEKKVDPVTARGQVRALNLQSQKLKAPWSFGH